jgi:hypothetical protein
MLLLNDIEKTPTNQQLFMCKFSLYVVCVLTKGPRGRLTLQLSLQ